MGDPRPSVSQERSADAAHPRHAAVWARLERALGARVPSGLDRLSVGDLGRLADVIEAAHRRESEELAAGRERALEFIPRLLRGPVRRIVG